MAGKDTVPVLKGKKFSLCDLLKRQEEQELIAGADNRLQKRYQQAMRFIKPRKNGKG